MSIIKEFKEFAIRGSVIDLAVGIVIGSAFTTIINSLVNDVIMPPINLITSEVDFMQWVLVLREGHDGISAITLNYGKFINASLQFLIVAFAVFLLVRSINRLRRLAERTKMPEKAPAEKIQEHTEILGEIRDLLKKSLGIGK